MPLRSEFPGVIRRVMSRGNACQRHENRKQGLTKSAGIGTCRISRRKLKAAILESPNSESSEGLVTGQEDP